MTLFRIFLLFSSFNLFICVSIDSLSAAEYIKIVTNATVNNKSSKLRNSPSAKWKIGRVTEKRYEIVNMLWRKTKIFGDVGSTTQTTSRKVLSKMKREHNSPEAMTPEKLSLSLPYLRRSSTPSFIEFHYLDLSDAKESLSNKNDSLSDSKDKSRPFINSPFFVFHVQYETCKSTNMTPEPGSANRDNFTKFLAYLTTPRKLEEATNEIDMETCPLTTLQPTTVGSSSSYYTISYNKQDWPRRETTMYDKIKFFELYDSDTPTPKNKNRTTPIAAHTKDNSRNQKGFFGDFNNYMSEMQITNKPRFVKKHITDKESSDYLNRFYKDFTRDRFTENTASPIKYAYKVENYHNLSHLATWSDFPFVAVYIYDPLQVRCDAAALSPHWLLAAASCLSRRYEDIYDEESQSAYVAYCTNNWRNPERISYVKRSLIHPRFDSNDYLKRQLYNIGVIEIVNSMAETCNGWAPISLISHQFDASAYGSMALALGWGLDRYNASYPMNTKYSLMMYENLVYSESCPGQTDLSKLTKHKNKINDVYCLSLPNYSDENNDEAYGAMLLIGGKLIALYLQEERRAGERAALYTGVWRHMPWLLHAAREPDDFVTFPLDFNTEF